METSAEEIYELAKMNGWTMHHKVFDQNPVDAIMDYCRKNKKIFNKALDKSSRV